MASEMSRRGVARRGVVAFLCVLAAVILGYLVYRDRSPAEPAKQVFTLRLAKDPSTLCLWLKPSGIATPISYLFSDRLYERDRANPGEWLPRLAVSYTQSDDGLECEFELRGGVKWPDGEPLTAEDVAFTFECLLNFGKEAIRGYFKDLDGPPKVIDPHRVRFVWKQPYFKAFDAICQIQIYPKHLLGPETGSETEFREKLLAYEGIGAGPYRRREWVLGQRLVFERNPMYWGPPAPLEEVQFVILDSSEVAFGELKKGGISLDIVPRDEWNSLPEIPDFQARFDRREGSRMAINIVGWNNRRAPFNDARVRRAMTHLCPGKDFIERIRNGMAFPITSSFYIDDPAYDKSIKPYAEDSVEAMKLLNNAGWAIDNNDNFLKRDGQKFEFDFLVNSENSDGIAFFGLLHGRLQKAGIVVNLKALDSSACRQLQEEGKFDAYWQTLTLEWDQDPYQLWYSPQKEKGDSSQKEKGDSNQKEKGGSNYVGFKNDEANRLILEARRELDNGKRNELYHALHRILHEEQPWTFICGLKDPFMWDKRYQIEFFDFFPNIDPREVTFGPEKEKMPK